MHQPQASTDDDLLDALVTGVLLLDAEDRVRRLNPAAQLLLGVGGRSVEGRALRAILPAPEPLLEVVQRARAEQTAFTVHELSLAAAGETAGQTAGEAGRALSLDCTAAPTGGADGEVLVELLDRTREARILRDAAFSEATGVSRGLARRLAHEVKTPLGGIRGAAQLLDRRLGDRDLARYTTVIIREADRLRGLVDAMLGPTRPAAREPVNVHSVLEHVREVLALSLPEGIRLVRDYDPSLPEVLADREQLIRVVMNLSVNAIQAIESNAESDGGRVTLGSTALRQFTIGRTRHRLAVAVTVHDDGPGVPEHLAERIFYPLVSGRADGTGLGLSLAQELVDRQGGLIEFETRPGDTVFRVVLPVAEEAGRAA